MRVLDSATRRIRQRRALHALEADNFQDDPHSDLKMSKKAPKFEETTISSHSSECNMTLRVMLCFQIAFDICNSGMGSWFLSPNSF